MAKSKLTRGGRPRVYRSSGHLSMRGEQADLELLRAYAAWRTGQEGKTVPLFVAVMTAVRESPSFKAFLKSRK